MSSPYDNNPRDNNPRDNNPRDNNERPAQGRHAGRDNPAFGDRGNPRRPAPHEPYRPVSQPNDGRYDDRRGDSRRPRDNEPRDNEPRYGETRYNETRYTGGYADTGYDDRQQGRYDDSNPRTSQIRQPGPPPLRAEAFSDTGRYDTQEPSAGGRPPSGGSPTNTKKKSPWRIVRRTLLALIALGLVVPILAFMVAYVVVDVPRPGDIKTDQVATILAADGSSVLGTVVPPEGNRTDVTIDQIPVAVRDAVLSAEDRDFYTNPGFSVSGFARAARDNVMGKDTAGGGSTITQQYVKNAILTSERSLTRKMRELVISSKMARQWTKDDILTAYLNTIYFGRGAYGISAAANAYFGKPVDQLTVEEGAVLAAVIQQPSGLDPENNLAGATDRWNYVLDGMVTMDKLDQGQRAAMIYPAWIPAGQADSGDVADAGPNGLIKKQVLREMTEAGISEQDLNTAGLQITTTIDPEAQQNAVEAATSNLEGEPENLRTASVSIDPRTGAVVSYYGGSDGNGFDFADAGLQTGSSFKVFALAAALDQGVPLSRNFDSSPLTVNGIEITNSEGASCGTCSIAEALKRSLNTSFYRLELSLDGGPQAIADMAHNLGIARSAPGIGDTLVEPDGSAPNNGIVLGQYQSRVLDMASAYGTLAASGMYHAPHFVQKVVTADGTVLLDRGADAGTREVSAAVADNVTSAMKPIAASSNGHSLAGGRQSAAKTGTAQLGDTGENKDAWMVGYTPSLSTAVWVGTEEGVALENSYGGPIYGSGLPSDIWKDTMDGALDGTPNETFPNPEAIAGQAGAPTYQAPAAPRTQQQAPAEQAPAVEAPPVFVPPVVVPSEVEIFPGLTIPIPGLAPASQPSEGQSQQEPATPGAGGGAGAEAPGGGSPQPRFGNGN